MENNVTSVDTLVYQLEDDDANVRWATLQRLRKRAAVERTQLPVRNPRRFLHCLRRRLSDEDPRIARETLLLLRDIVDVLGDDVDQLLSSVLPHLIVRLSSTGNETESALDEDTFSVFRKYANVTNDLSGVANLLVNMGLAHTQPSIREAALLALVRLLEERYGGRRLMDIGSSKKVAARIDTALFTELIQAAVPALEDADESVVVAAEEMIAKIQLFWGPSGYQSAMQFLSSEDKATLQVHGDTIRAFVEATMNGGVSVSASQVLALRASLPTGTLPMPTTTLRYGYIESEIIDALLTNRGNSNAEWKKRTSAVEQLYAATKKVDARVLGTVAFESTGSLTELFEILLRLLQDIDIHLVKRSLQIQRLLFYKLEPRHEDEYEESIDLTVYVERVLPVLVETAANYAEDEEITLHMYTVFQTLFSGQTVNVSGLLRPLLSCVLHRRLQVREEALKIWIVLLLTVQTQSLSSSGLVNDAVLNALGKVLGDGSARVRSMAMEVTTVVGRVTRQDISAIIEAHIDDYTLERIDLDALYARTRDPRLPMLLENGQLRLVSAKNSSDKPVADAAGTTKAVYTQSSIRTSSSSVGPATITPRERTELLDGPSELLQFDPRGSHGISQRDPQGIGDPADPSARTSARWSQARTEEPKREETRTQWRSESGKTSQVPVARDVSSAPSEPIVTEKLQMLKRKTEMLRKSASTKQVTGVPPNREFNPQEGEIEFASSGYAAQQQPSPKQIVKQLNRTPRLEEEEDKGYPPPLRPPTVNKMRREESQQSGLIKQVKPQTPTTQIDNNPSLSNDDRPIRPMQTADFDEYAPVYDAMEEESIEPKKRRPVAMSLATKKRLEAKQRQEEEASRIPQEVEEHTPSEPSPEAPKPRALSLATRKRQEAQARVHSEDGTTSGVDKPLKRSSMGEAPPSSFGKQDPRYLEPHELLPLKDAKQEANKVVSNLRSEDWEIVFEALNTVRRLATHHPKLIEDKLHGLVTEILKQVPNLRSSVAKNALLALDSLCVAMGKQLDTNVDNIVPVLLKRCTDSNAFVCESTSQSLHRVILHCSTTRVVPAIAAHITSRAVPIRREVARSMHAVIVGLGDQVHIAKEFTGILQVVAKCLEDSNNEVRDAAKQSVVYLHSELGMDGDAIKRILPTSVHGKIEPILTRKVLGFPGGTKGSREPINTLKPVAKGAPRRGVVVDNDALTTLTKKLDSSNWKDRFDALSETVAFVSQYSTSLIETGKLLPLMDSLLKRLDDGNAKVSTLALELLPSIITTLGNGLELVLLTFVPAVAKGLASSNAKQAALALAAMRALCTHVDARLLCQHVAAITKHANSRVKPMLVDVLAELAATKDETNQFALTRYVLPVALELLKEGKSDVKDVTARLVRALYDALGPTVIHAASKLSSAQHDRLSVILGV